MNHRSTLVAAFGHAWLRDQSFPLKVIARLRGRSLPPEVEIADWTFGTLTAYQKLAAGGYRRCIFLAVSDREELAPGTLRCARPRITLPDTGEIHGRIGDCVMGAVSVENLLVIASYYDALPADVVLIEARAVDDTWGDDLSPAMAALVDPAVDAVLAAIGEGAS